MKLEVPYSPELAEAVWLAAGGTILAAQSALRDGFGCNLSGGFHHAYAKPRRRLLRDSRCRRCHSPPASRRRAFAKRLSSIPTCTTAMAPPRSFATIPRVFTLSIHQENNYPSHKPPSTLDLDLADRVEDDEYLDILIPAVEKSLDEFKPEILFYVGGADPYCEDQLGGLRLTKSGLKARDKGVFQFARSRHIPIVTTLAGGYARRVEDTIRIHANTIVAAQELFSTLTPARQAAN